MTRAGKGLVLLTLVGMVVCFSLPARGEIPGTNNLRDLQNSFRAVARTVTPAVVNVSAVRIIAQPQQMHGIDPFFENHPFREFFGDEFFRRFFTVPGEDRPYRQKGLASGFLFDPRGFLFTNRHVIQGADEIWGSEKRQFTANLEARIFEIVMHLGAKPPQVPLTVASAKPSGWMDTPLGWGGAKAAAVAESSLGL